MMKMIDRTEIADYIGYESEPTPWHTVTQEQIDRFADCTLDRQFIHVDPELARQTPFGGTIAHGFLTLSLLTHFATDFAVLVKGVQMAVNGGLDKVRFVAPVPVNSRIRARATVLDIQERNPGQLRFVMRVTVDIEGSERPALVADWITVQMVA